MMVGGRSGKRTLPLYVPFATIAAAATIAVSAFSFMNVMELGRLAKEGDSSYKENVLDQSSSLSRLIFSAYRVLSFVPVQGEPPEQTLRRRIVVYDGLFSHAEYVRKIDRTFVGQILGEDPLLLGERIDASDRDYEAALNDLRATFGRIERSADAAESAEPNAGDTAKLIEDFQGQTAILMRRLESRSAILTQLEDYVFIASQDRISRILGHSRLLTLSLAALLAVFAVSFGMYLRSLLKTQSELSLHRNHLRELVEQRTVQLTSANSRLRAEIEERRKAETALKTLVSEKETLLKEVYHRVKNNLNMVNGLISLQKDKLPPEASQPFDDLESRISAIALIHEKLYRSTDLAEIALEEYLADLAKGLLFSLCEAPDMVRLEVSAPGIRLPADVLIPLGLIAAEVMTNSIKHGFRFQGDDVLSIRAAVDDGLTIIMGDNGKPPANPDAILKSKSLGALLIQTLCGQLKGTMELNLEGGTEYAFRFPLSQADVELA